MGEGWREGERWTCSYTPLPWWEVTIGRVTPGPSAHSPTPSPHLPVQPPGESRMLRTENQRRVGSLKPRLVLPSFPLFLPTPSPLPHLSPF